MTGQTLSHYQIDAELGRGGMGVVYRATDTKLNRTVALKVLPAAALASPDDRARFVREAQSAAQLHHPNIATVFGIDEAVPEGEGAGSESRLFIAMEYIEGETLREHAQKGPMKLQQAVSIAGQIAEALKEAHAKDIVHRDIKSANIMLTEAGVAKVLDFGLAKTNASTMLTRMGSTLGTVAYMSPEQARGQEVDGRSDLYSLGTVLYEMVAGVLPFAGDYEQAVLYSILNETPEPLTAIRTGVPMQLEWIVNKLLAKEAEYRYQTAADLLADLKSLDLSGSGRTQRSMPAVSAVGQSPGGGHGLRPAWWMVAAALALGLVTTWLLKPTPGAPPPPTLKLSVNTGSVEVLGHPRVSPDLAYMAFLGRDTLSLDEGIFVYETRTRELRHVPDSDDYEWPAFSSDGRWLVLGGLRNGMAKLPVAGGRPVPFHDGVFRGWFSADEIFVADGRGFVTIDMNGTPTGRSYHPDSTSGYESLFAPVMLPGRKAFLTDARRLDGSTVDVVLVDVGTGDIRTLVSGARGARYVDSGHLLYLVGEWQGDVLAQPFDARRGELIGDAVPLGIQASLGSFAATPEGVLTMSIPVETFTERSMPTWIDVEQGDRSPLGLPVANYSFPSFSNSGGYLALEVVNESENQRDIVVVDLATGLDTRRTFEGSSSYPAWSQDDAWIYYSALRGRRWQIYRRPSDGSGQEEAVDVGIDLGRATAPHASKEGGLLALQGSLELRGSTDIFVTSLLDTTRTWHYERGSFQTTPVLAPDGSHVAFYTIENQQPGEIYVQEVGSDASFVVSRPGEEAFSGRTAWSSDGSWLYYGNRRGEIRRARVSLDPVFRVEGHETVATGVGLARFALHPDDDRLLVLIEDTPAEQERHFSFDITMNVQTELNRIAPPRDSR